MSETNILSKQTPRTLMTIYHDLLLFYDFYEPELIDSISGYENFTKEEILEQIKTCLNFDEIEHEQKHYLIQLIETIDEVEEEITNRFYSMLAVIQLFYYYGEELLTTNEQVIICFMGVYLKTSRKELEETVPVLLNSSIVSSIIEECENDVGEAVQYLYEKKLELMSQGHSIRKRLLN